MEKTVTLNKVFQFFFDPKFFSSKCDGYYLSLTFELRIFQLSKSCCQFCRKKIPKVITSWWLKVDFEKSCWVVLFFLFFSSSLIPPLLIDRSCWIKVVKHFVLFFSFHYVRRKFSVHSTVVIYVTTKTKARVKISSFTVFLLPHGEKLCYARIGENDGGNARKSSLCVWDAVITSLDATGSAS